MPGRWSARHAKGDTLEQLVRSVTYRLRRIAQPLLCCGRESRRPWGSSTSDALLASIVKAHRLLYAAAV